MDVKAFVDDSQHFEFTEWGKVKCVTTGHEVAANMDAITTYMTTAKFIKATEWYGGDYSAYEPHVVESIKDPKKLYCNLTYKLINKRPDVVASHVKSRKFLAAKRLAEAKEDAADPTDTSVPLSVLEQLANEGDTASDGEVQPMKGKRKSAKSKAPASSEEEDSDSDEGAAPSPEPVKAPRGRKGKSKKGEKALPAAGDAEPPRKTKAGKGKAATKGKGKGKAAPAAPATATAKKAEKSRKADPEDAPAPRKKRRGVSPAGNKPSPKHTRSGRVRK